jgi:hypothetical protein
LLLTLLITGVLTGLPSDPPPGHKMKVTYHPDAKRPHEPNEPFWQGPTPCGEYPTDGQGILRLTRDGKVKPPKLLRKQRGDYSRLTSKTRAFTTLFAQYILSAEGRITEVTVLRSVSDEFDALVLGELESAEYEPATLEGHPVAVCVVFTATAHP